MELKEGTVLVAKAHHPERYMGGTGIAVVIDEANGTSFIGIEWVGGNGRRASEDVASINHIDTWFDVIEDSQKAQYLPADWKPSNRVKNMMSFLQSFAEQQK